MKGKILSLYAVLGVAAFLVGCEPAPPAPPAGGPTPSATAPGEGPGMSGPAPKVTPGPEGTPTPEPSKPAEPSADAPKPENPQP